MPGLRSLRNRLAVIFALIVLGAIATIYLSVTPRLEQSLIRQKIDQLVLFTRRYAPRVADMESAGVSKAVLARRSRAEAGRDSVEVLVLGVWRGQPLTGATYSITDSTPDGGVKTADVQGIAQQAVLSRHVATGAEPTANGRQAIAARPIVLHKQVAYVLVFADSLSDVQANVALIRNQVLISGGIALVIS